MKAWELLNEKEKEQALELKEKISNETSVLRARRYVNQLETLVENAKLRHFTNSNSRESQDSESPAIAYN